MEKEHTPILNGFSERVISRPPDWGSHIQMTGWWMPEDLDAEEDTKTLAWTPPDDLLRFLAAGSPPVFIGFGSMPVRDPPRVPAMILDAVRSSQQRAILHTGWAGLGGNLPESVYQIEYAPYRWLFPHMAAVVHHGGSGTTGYALSSSVPSFVVPFGFDQGMLGSRGAQLGVGPKPLPFQSLTSGKLAEHIRDATGNPAYRESAAALGKKLCAERGVLRAVEIIEQWMNVP